MTATLAPTTPATTRRWLRRAGRPGPPGRGGGDAWKLVLPALLPVVLFSVYPLLRGIYLGFTDAEAGRNVTTSFNGLENYRNLWDNSLFWQSFRIGLGWTISVTTLQFFASLGLALLLNLDLRLRWIARTLALVPWAMPPVIVAIMWRLMLHPRSGPVNKVIREIGFAGDTNWLGDFKTALPAVIVVGVWSGMPQTTIALLAGLQSVPEELHEAAAIDGASARKRFRFVTFPALRPVIVAITTLDMINNFNSFALVFVLTAGGPGGRTMLPSLFAYNEAFRYGHWGYAAAMGNVMVVIVGAFLIVYLIANRRGIAR
jgi:multiple sugar transport system permease protein